MNDITANAGTIQQFQTVSADEAKIKTTTSALVATARATVIVDPQTHEIAIKALRALNEEIKAVEADKEKIWRPLKTVADEISKRYKAILDPLEAVKGELNKKLLAWDEQQRRIAWEKSEAERKEREEAALKEAARQEEERIAQEAAIRKSAEETAARLAAEGKTEEAAQVTAQTEAVIKEIAADTQAQTFGMMDETAKVGITHQATTRVDGGMVTVQQRWTHEVTDISKVPTAYLVLNDAAVTKAIREGVREIAGVRIYQKGVVSSR